MGYDNAGVCEMESVSLGGYACSPGSGLHFCSPSRSLFPGTHVHGPWGGWRRGEGVTAGFPGATHLALWWAPGDELSSGSQKGTRQLHGGDVSHSLKKGWGLCGDSPGLLRAGSAPCPGMMPDCCVLSPGHGLALWF